jgi:bacterial/archaeal transporter family protein
MNWIYWSLLSALFAGATAILAKVGVAGVDSNLATAIRTSVILVFSWLVAYATAPPAALRHTHAREPGSF